MPKSSLPEELARFVRHNTVSSRSNASFARYIGRLLKQSGFRVSYQKKKAAGQVFVNVIGIKGKGGRPFLVCSHLDTVPPGSRAMWTTTSRNPWKAAIKNGSVYGLGTADDKGSLLAMLAAGSSVTAQELKRPLVILGTFGEESGMGGAQLFSKAWRMPKPCCALVGEPTRLGITYRHKGLGVIEIDLELPRKIDLPKKGEKAVFHFKGRQGHSSRPHLGVNALEKAMDFLARYVKSNPNARLISIEGGTAANLIPARASLTFLKNSPRAAGFDLSGPLLLCYDSVREMVAKLQSKGDRSFSPPVMTSNFGIAATKGRTTRLVFDFRLLPRQSIKEISLKLKKALAHKLKPYPVKWRLRLERDNPPLELERGHPLVQTGIKLLKKCGLPVTLSVKPSCTEAGIYSSWGVPAIIFGPGQSNGNIHAPNESIRIKEIEQAVDFYRKAIHAFCVEGKKCF